MAEDGKADNEAVEAFIARWSKSGGAERANYQLFLSELCDLIGVGKPDPAQESNQFNDYVFDRSVAFKHEDGTQTTKFADLYKRNSFVLEAKQSSKRDALRKTQPDQLVLVSEDETQVKAGTARRGTGGWDTPMLNARRQAEGYAKALPKEHGWPPFLIVVDVGHCIELWADFVRQGKNYVQFPDRRGYRIMLEDLRDADIRARLAAVWTDPLSLDPARKSAEVTRDIAERLARIAKALEARGHDAGKVAEFLMRCLFTMFAEDVKLLPEGSLTKSSSASTVASLPAQRRLRWSRTKSTNSSSPRGATGAMSSPPFSAHCWSARWTSATATSSVRITPRAPMSSGLSCPPSSNR